MISHDEENPIEAQYQPMTDKQPLAPMEQESKEDKDNGVMPKVRSGLVALSCMKDSVKIGGAAGAAVGFASTAVIGGLLCAPSILCNKEKENKMQHIKEGAKITGYLGAGIGGLVGIKVGCVAGCVSAPFAFFFGEPKACTDLSNKIDEQVIKMVQGEAPKPQMMV
ncbi:MAG: hypothetical protein P4M14_10705 [Gammaproteobacteria bacterium]|nr:hypothetical protein [Gammaproteobacteria bacterium]